MRVHEQSLGMEKRGKPHKHDTYHQQVKTLPFFNLLTPAWLIKDLEIEAKPCCYAHMLGFLGHNVLYKI